VEVAPKQPASRVPPATTADWNTRNNGMLLLMCYRRIAGGTRGCDIVAWSDTEIAVKLIRPNT
jgi:hypothetical protein